MKELIEKYKLSISVLLWMVLSAVVGYNWWLNKNTAEENRIAKNKETTQLLVQQVEQRVLESMGSLQNLKHRLEITNGDYFEYWESDAAQIIEKNSSFELIEWIDSSMIVQMIYPIEGNEKALGLDISKIDYRRGDWLKARNDSLLNLTPWKLLVQGELAFLVDAPVYINEEFMGTITAAMDFTHQFDRIFQGLDQYYITLKDENGRVFYQHGQEAQKTGFANVSEAVISFRDEGVNTGNWTFILTPNRNYSAENADGGMYLILLLGLGLCMVVAVMFYFMQEAFLAHRQARYANEKIRALIDSSPMAIYALDTNGKVVDFWNKAAEDLLGWKREEVLGRFLPHVSEEQKDEFWNIMQESFESGSLKNREIQRVRKDGSTGYFRLNLGHVVTDRNKDRLMMAILEDITQERTYQKKLEQSVKEKEVLLTEIHHRVKNNLAIIAGLIELQKDGLEDAHLSEILNETQNRIYSISGVHELLYQTESFTKITFEEYAVKLIQRIRGMFESKGKDVSINYQFNTRNLNINQAIPLGLLINELITNSFKHAFNKQDKGEIFLSLSEVDGRIYGEYRDNGKGFSNEVFEQSSTLGITLIKTLIGQLGADYSINAANGLLLKFSFTVKEKGAHSNISSD